MPLPETEEQQGKRIGALVFLVGASAVGELVGIITGELSFIYGSIAGAALGGAAIYLNRK